MPWEFDYISVLHVDFKSVTKSKNQLLLTPSSDVYAPILKIKQNSSEN